MRDGRWYDDNRSGTSTSPSVLRTYCSADVDKTPTDPPPERGEWDDLLRDAEKTKLQNEGMHTSEVHRRFVSLAATRVMYKSISILRDCKHHEFKLGSPNSAA